MRFGLQPLAFSALSTEGHRQIMFLWDTCPARQMLFSCWWFLCSWETLTYSTLCNLATALMCEWPDPAVWVKNITAVSSHLGAHNTKPKNLSVCNVHKNKTVFSCALYRQYPLRPVALQKAIHDLSNAIIAGSTVLSLHVYPWCMVGHWTGTASSNYFWAASSSEHEQLQVNTELLCGCCL